MSRGGIKSLELEGRKPDGKSQFNDRKISTGGETMPDSENVSFIGQMVGLKNLKAEGGWRLTIDIFDSRIQDALLVATLVHKKETVKITVEPFDDNLKWEV